MAALDTHLMPWEHVTPALCCKAAEDWLTVHDRTFERVHVVEWWAVFYECRGEARHQRWEIHRKDNRDDGTLVPAGVSRVGWPIHPE